MIHIFCLTSLYLRSKLCRYDKVSYFVCHNDHRGYYSLRVIQDGDATLDEYSYEYCVNEKQTIFLHEKRMETAVLLFFKVFKINQKYNKKRGKKLAMKYIFCSESKHKKDMKILFLLPYRHKCQKT